MDYIKITAAMAVTFVAFDGLWLGLVAQKFYQKHIGHIMAAQPNFTAAALFYVIYLIGLLVLVVVPAGRAYSLVQAVGMGALFGLVCYASYDLTNQAVTKNWPSIVTIVDLTWGVFITTVVAVVGYWVASVLFV
jgi:uncharacterized membrane protein